MSDLISKLMDFGFTKTDALVYINLLKSGRASGYKIAKAISLSRSSVYSSIDNLYNSGYIFMSDGSTKEYEAKSPELIFNQIEKKTVENIGILKKELSKMMLQKEEEFIFSLTGYNHLIQKARELINQSEVEIYLNTDFRLSIFHDEICQAIERGVRIICFSFNRIEKPHEKIELYSRSDKEETLYPSRRFMLVVDMARALIFSNKAETKGVYTNNQLMIDMTAEHIHNDIYLRQYESRFGIEKVNIRTIHEQTSQMVVDDLNRQKE